MDSIWPGGTAQGCRGLPDRSLRERLSVHLTCSEEDVTAKRHRLGEKNMRGGHVCTLLNYILYICFHCPAEI